MGSDTICQIQIHLFPDTKYKYENFQIVNTVGQIQISKRLFILRYSCPDYVASYHTFYLFNIMYYCEFYKYAFDFVPDASSSTSREGFHLAMWTSTIYASNDCICGMRWPSG